MKMSYKKKNKILLMINNSLFNLPTPLNINMWWNFGSLLGIYLIIQIISGFFLSMNYCPNINYAFDSIIHIMKDIKGGWILRFIHMNGASFYFLLMYIHIGRGIYYHSYKFLNVWMIGIMIYLISMATAFLGYVLPWGQMSLWGATVITNLLSAIPYIGLTIVKWIWGGFSINNATLNRFYSLHFLLPLIILIMVSIHLMFLHATGSNNPMGINSNYYKINFNPYFLLKDILGMLLIFIINFLLIIKSPYYLSDPDNFITANPMNTPEHIKPEWYFLFAYSILRSIPSKLGGVIFLLLSIFILMSLPLLNNYMIKSSKFYLMNQLMFWIFINSFILLTWLGGQLIEYPFINLNKFITMIYFMYFIMMPFMNFLWDKILLKKIN